MNQTLYVSAHPRTRRGGCGLLGGMTGAGAGRSTSDITFQVYVPVAAVKVWAVEASWTTSRRVADRGIPAPA